MTREEWSRRECLRPTRRDAGSKKRCTAAGKRKRLEVEKRHRIMVNKYEEHSQSDLVDEKQSWWYLLMSKVKVLCLDEEEGREEGRVPRQGLLTLLFSPLERWGNWTRSLTQHRLNG